jgi:ABC-type multidrug transport system ATPase subunit
MAVPRDRPYRAMSRGEATKAMLAATLAPEPEVLLLDEPFGGLDPVAHEEVLRAVVDALGVGTRTVLVSTHDLDVAARLGDRVVVLAGGRIRRDVPMDQAAGAEGGRRREALRGLLAEAIGGP